MRSRWWLLHCGSNRQANWHLWLCINLKCYTCTYFATCQLLLDFSDQIVRHDNSSRHVQGSDRSCRYSRHHRSLTDNQWTWYRPAHHYSVRQLKLNYRRNSPTRYTSVMSYDSSMQRSKRNTKLNESQQSCCIRSWIQLPDSQHRPGAHGRDVENCLS